MSGRQKYRKKADHLVTAIPLDLEMDEFSYHKWGDTQRCKAGDWLVHNQDEVYTVDRDTFERTYREVSPGRYQKIQCVWAEQADAPGRVQTLEGWTHYEAGDYLVCNDDQGNDCYSISAERFHQQYQLDDDPSA